MKSNSLFYTQLLEQIQLKKSHMCVGLDVDWEKFPDVIKNNFSVEDGIFEFNKKLIDATHDVVVAYKPNVVFYAGHGLDGYKALRRTNEYLKKNYPEIKIYADCKRSEMARSAEMAAKEIFDHFLFDVIMITPWFGLDTLAPYQNYQGKAASVYCHDSNPSAIEVQDLELKDGRCVYEEVTRLVCDVWNQSGNIFIEAPLTYPKQLKKIIDISRGKNQLFLLAGLGAQGGDLEILKEFKEEKNFIISASRSIIYASSEDDFAQKSREMVLGYQKEINNMIY